MKKNICCVLVSLIMLSVIYICDFNNVESMIINTEKDVKFVDSEILLASADSFEISDVIEVVDDVEDEDIDEVIENTVKIEETTTSEIQSEEKEVIKEEKIEESVPTVKEEVNEIVVGKMTGYGPDCYGCSGYLAYGMYVGDGTIYYNDSEYGMVRIVAGDKKYKFGTIVKINDSMLAIVLDRGGSIGIGKKFLFDLLYPSEAEASYHGVMTDVKFEILRNGF